MRRIRAIVSGRVQGVGFRAFTVEEARSLSLTGWVKNLHDGTVELEAQGEPDAVAALAAWCRHGPPSAKVTDVFVEDVPLVDGERTFSQMRR